MSGAGNFSDNSELGTFVEPAQPFNDTNPEHVAAIDAHMKPNGAVDKLILDAAVQGMVNAYFVTPGGIYGASEQHVARRAVNEGVTEAKRYAEATGVWFGWMLSNITDYGFSPYVGPGTSLFPVIYVDDVVELTLKVLNVAIKNGQKYQPEDVFKHYYLGISETLPAKELATMFAGAAARSNLISTPEVKSVPYQKPGATGYAAANRYLAGNIIVKAENAKKLGWKPQGTSLREYLEAS